MKPRPPASPEQGRASLDIIVSDATRAHWVPARKQFLEWGTAALPRARTAVLLSIRIVGKTASERLNTRYRRKRGPTNILSFAGTAVVPGPRFLGELIICAPVVAREARAQRKKLEAHWAHLTVHGVLHLLGMDHESAPMARKMESREIQILDRLGFSDPYA